MNGHMGQRDYRGLFFPDISHLNIYNDAKENPPLSISANTVHQNEKEQLQLMNIFCQLYFD